MVWVHRYHTSYHFRVALAILGQGPCSSKQEKTQKRGHCFLISFSGDGGHEDYKHQFFSLTFRLINYLETRERVCIFGKRVILVLENLSISLNRAVKEQKPMV